jgi:hypothetical protein
VRVARRRSDQHVVEPVAIEIARARDRRAEQIARARDRRAEKIARRDPLGASVELQRHPSRRDRAHDREVPLAHRRVCRRHGHAGVADAHARRRRREIRDREAPGLNACDGGADPRRERLPRRAVVDREIDVDRPRMPPLHLGRVLRDPHLTTLRRHQVDLRLGDRVDATTLPSA